MRIAATVGIAVFVWWLGTALVLALNSSPRRTYPAALAGAVVASALALEGVFLTRDALGADGAVGAFVCAIVLWGCQEMAFYMGAITGPNRAACAPGCVGWARVRAATRAVLHHELALAAGMLLVLALTSGHGNQTATAVYAVLWVMRLSAKFNVFLGVRNLHAEFVPVPVRYLVSYMRCAPMNALYPVSLVASSAMLLVLLDRVRMDADAATGLLLAATMLALAILEHGFMMLPLPSAKLWRWAMRAPAHAAPLTHAAP